ncbi:MAG TPA: winged helix DNA-binding protein [Methanomassiliicoccales archaeon]|nr:winged helix DNA-binding protein [Methanomassiliicoccales archaeon]
MKSKWIALIVAVAGIALVLYGVLTPTDSGGTSGGMNGGVDTDRTTYEINNIVLIITGAFIAGTGLSYWAFKEDYVPIAVNSSPPATEVRVEHTKEPVVTSTVEEAQGVEDVPPNVSNENLLVLRLLNGDERFMYRTIVDLGGSALQKDLIVRTKMSDSKVSRVIDRLIEKGLVTKERHGVTNKVSVSIEK